MKLLQIGFISAVSIITGCASITGDSMQSLSVSTQTAGGDVVSDAKCLLTNDRGQWSVTTPNFIRVRKASGDLTVKCEKLQFAPGTLRAISRAGTGMYGNILIGGGIGALIDHNKGVAYNYPDDLPVVMGKTITVDRRNQQSKTKK